MCASRHQFAAFGSPLQDDTKLNGRGRGAVVQMAAGSGSAANKNGGGGGAFAGSAFLVIFAAPLNNLVCVLQVVAGFAHNDDDISAGGNPARQP